MPEVVADSCGVTACQEALRTAMTIGADRAILVETTEELQSTVFANQAFGVRETSMDTIRGALYSKSMAALAKIESIRMLI